MIENEKSNIYIDTNSQEELLKQAQLGSEDAFNTLKDKYKPLILSQAQSHYNHNMSEQDLEELKQEALICFSSAVFTYKFEHKVEFGLYAKICISNGLNSFIRAFDRHKKTGVVSLDEDDENFELNLSVEDDPCSKIIEEENFLALKRLIQNNLSNYESQIWWLFTSGMKISDIAKKVGKTDVRSVYNAIYRIRKKLQIAIKNQSDKP